MTNDTIPAKPVNKNIIWIIITLLLLIGNILLLVSLMNAKSDLERFSDAADEISNLDIELSDCRVRLDDAMAGKRQRSESRVLRQASKETQRRGDWNIETFGTNHQRI